MGIFSDLHTSIIVSKLEASIQKLHALRSSSLLDTQQRSFISSLLENIGTHWKGDELTGVIDKMACEISNYSASPDLRKELDVISKDLEDVSKNTQGGVIYQTYLLLRYFLQNTVSPAPFVADNHHNESTEHLPKETYNKLVQLFDMSLDEIKHAHNRLASREDTLPNNAKDVSVKINRPSTSLVEKTSDESASPRIK